MAVRYYDWMAGHARRTPERLALIDLASGRRFTYREADARVARLAGFLKHIHGIGRGDRVAVLSPNSTDFFDLQFACARLGAIFLPLNWRLAVPELAFILGDATPGLLIYDREFADTVAQLAVAAKLELDTGAPTSAFERGIAAATPLAVPETMTHDDVWTVMYTSGTTGRPKGALITYGMTTWNAVNLGGPARVTGGSVGLTVLPLFHTGGLNCYANVILHAGGTVVVMRTFDPGAALALIGDARLGLTHFFGVPTNYLFMSQHNDFATTDFSRLKLAGVGGASPPVPLLETWGQRGVGLQQGYGMTETSPTVLVLEAEDAIRKAGSTGVPALHTEVRIVDAEGRDVAPGEVGELWVKGPNVTPGYWNRPDATAESITDGWLHTGDATRMDADGFYYIVDRWKDMYISGGENVYPAEVESALYRLPAVAEAAVIGVPDPRWGEAGLALVVVKPGLRLEEGEVIGHCLRELAKYKVPKAVRFVPELPHNATGKILKRELRLAYGAK
jgi:fatty-acyl-CoA synthase